MSDDDLALLRTKLKSGEYDGADVMRAWIAIDELLELRARDAARLPVCHKCHGNGSTHADFCEARQAHNVELNGAP